MYVPQLFSKKNWHLKICFLKSYQIPHVHTCIFQGRDGYFFTFTRCTATRLQIGPEHRSPYPSVRIRDAQVSTDSATNTLFKVISQEMKCYPLQHSEDARLKPRDTKIKESSSLGKNLHVQQPKPRKQHETTAPRSQWEKN